MHFYLQISDHIDAQFFIQPFSIKIAFYTYFHVIKNFQRHNFKINLYRTITYIQKSSHIQNTTQKNFTKWTHLYNQNPDEETEYYQLSEAPSYASCQPLPTV